MSGYYPDGVNQAIFDRYWNELDVLDEPIDIDEDLLSEWYDRSELFAPPICGMDGGVE